MGRIARFLLLSNRASSSLDGSSVGARPAASAAQMSLMSHGAQGVAEGVLLALKRRRQTKPKKDVFLGVTIARHTRLRSKRSQVAERGREERASERENTFISAETAPGKREKAEKEGGEGRKEGREEGREVAIKGHQRHRGRERGRVSAAAAAAEQRRTSGRRP